MDTLGVVYNSQANAWMNTDVFMQRYTEVFLPEVSDQHDGKKCLLLLDNAPSHPSVGTLNAVSDSCEVKFLPPNVTSLIQPMDQGIIEKVKKAYRHKLPHEILIHEHLDDIVKRVKSWTLFQCCKFISAAWDSVTESNARNAWNKLVKDQEWSTCDDPSLEPESFLELVRKLPECQDSTPEDTTAWMELDSAEQGWQILSDDEIIKEIRGNHLEEEEEEEEEIVSQEEVESINPRDIVEQMENIEKWISERWECTNTDLRWFRYLQSVAQKEVILNKRP